MAYIRILWDIYSHSRETNQKISAHLQHFSIPASARRAGSEDGVGTPSRDGDWLGHPPEVCSWEDADIPWNKRKSIATIGVDMTEGCSPGVSEIVQLWILLQIVVLILKIDFVDVPGFFCGSICTSCVVPSTDIVTITLRRGLFVIYYSSLFSCCHNIS